MLAGGPGFCFFYRRRCPENMRTPICEILLILLLLQAPTDHGLEAGETEEVPNLKALAIYAPRPQYPYEARARRQVGAGVAIVMVDPNTGLVTNAEMAKSTGYQLLDKAALNAFRQWQFKPGRVAMVKIPITFTMGGSVITELKVTRNKDMDTVLAPFLGKGTVLHGPNPAYPRNAQWTDKQGKGTYELHVGKDGKVEDVRILKNSGDATFDHVAVSTLRAWRLRKGPMVVELPLAFKLPPRRYDVWIP
jgi:TonB family protein